MSRKWKKDYIYFIVIYWIFYDTDTYTKPQTEYGISHDIKQLAWAEFWWNGTLTSSQGALHLSHGVGVWGWPRSPDSLDLYYFSPLLLPLPTHSWEAATTLSFSQWADSGWHCHTKSVLWSLKFPRKGGLKDNHLPKDWMLKYKVRLQLSLARLTITFKLTRKWEENWLFSSQ